jgi:septum formation protein
MRLILASTSPRRHDLLTLLQIPFEVAAPTFVEQLARGVSPEQQAKCFAEQKARSCAQRFPEALVLGSDTLISLGGEILGKPADAADAAAMLRRLCGRAHEVHTAVALGRHADPVLDAAVETVRVWMRGFSEAEAEEYLRSGESMGKAGAYSIQGRGGDLVSRIEGDYPTVVGLPLRLVASLLRRRGVQLPLDVEDLYRRKPYPNWERFDLAHGSKA